jgi:glutathionylspermidine synthase
MVVMTSPLRAGPLLSADEFAHVRRRTIFECCKWDPQFEDVRTLAPFPLVLEVQTWRSLAADAVELGRETLAAEAELLLRPDLHANLSLSRPVRRALQQAAQAGATHGIARTLRFDFHPTAEGWRISEVNSDVPGGFIEAQGFTTLMAETCPDLRPTGSPADVLFESITAAIGPRASIGLIHATAYSDDRQVMTYLQQAFERRGATTHLVSPHQVAWTGGRASLSCDWGNGPLDALVRFYPAEWLPELPHRSDWTHYFAGGRTPLCNPATALLTQSKRLPLVWDQLETPLPTWRRCLPETRSPREVDWRSNGTWLVKPALGRVGEDVAVRSAMSATAWRRIARSARWFPRHWVAQRQFESLSVETPLGPMHVCLGIFVIDGRAAGIYGRMARVPLIDARAYDVAVLIDAED